jgi:hypothetical protein
MTLTEAAIFTKKALIGLGVFLFVSLIGWLSYQYYLFNIKPKQVVEEKADPNFGLLPKLQFITSNTPSSSYTYTLDTTTGALPKDTPKFLKIYLIPQLGASLLAPDRAKNLAASFKFNNGPTITNSTTYTFTDDNNGRFTIDLNSGNFSFDHKLFASDSAKTLAGDIREEPILPDDSKIVDDFKGYLQSKGLLKELLTKSKSKVNYDAELLQNANHAQISLWENDLDSYKMVTPTFTSGLVSGTVTKWNEETQKYLTLNYTYWGIDQGSASTYNIIPPTTAYEEYLKKGQAAIIVKPPTTQVSITEVYLAYYLPPMYQQYLQPVYVFEGPNFAAYVPAVDPEFVQK